MTIATAAIAEIQLYYKKNVSFLKYCKMSLKEYIFCNDNIIGPMSSSHPFTIMSLEQAKQNVVTQSLTYFTISQIVSRKGSMFQKLIKPLQMVGINRDMVLISLNTGLL